MKRVIQFLLVLAVGSCSAISDFVENKRGGRKFSSSDPSFDMYIARFEEVGKKYTEDPYFQVGDIPINFGDTENPMFDGVCFSYANGDKEIIIKKSWWDRHTKKKEEEDTDETSEKGDTSDNDDGSKEKPKKDDEKDNYSLIRESLIFHELGHCRLNRKHEETLISADDKTNIEVKKSMMSHNIITANEYRKYKDGYWAELFTGSADTLEGLIKGNTHQ